MKTTELREKFLAFFRQRDHQVVTSSSLVPAHDPSLLFTNAGMVQFKEVFLGREPAQYSRAVSSQRCVRAGGKHNDLENVGYTARHHTFFEMLGNFSFGDYFKREAIEYAWVFLTNILAIPPEKLWITVFEEDSETEAIWLNEIKIDPQRFSRIGAKDNFWSMGDTGPCGPCTEIFYDHGPNVSGGPPGMPEEEGDRFVEIWNLVFMQHNRSKNGDLTPLPKPSVDTGMGLERIAAVMQSVQSNYEIDLFANLITVAADIVGIRETQHTSLKVIADHIRSCSFLIADGVVPSNEGRGYVLRRIIRRAARHGYELGKQAPFFYRLVPTLCDEMGDAYPELLASQSLIMTSLEQEEMRFSETLMTGMKLLDEAIANLSGTTLSGETVFKLYDTHGFPVDLTADIAQSKGLSIDLNEFNQAMEAQRQRAQAASRFDGQPDQMIEIKGNTEFVGYEQLQCEAKITALYVEGRSVQKITTGETGLVILSTTPFYAEAGGQVGDQGEIVAEQTRYRVKDTQKQGENVVGHFGILEQGTLWVDQQVQAQVKYQHRQETALHHSATHLLHAALHRVLGSQVKQKGSHVNHERLRFDFSHSALLSVEQINEIEGLVNTQVRGNASVETSIMTAEDALKSGAMALFGEKYGEQVRVLSMGDFSTELCGGTHVKRTGDIGFFKIIAESGVAAGVRRIEAVAGSRAVTHVLKNEAILDHVAQLMKGHRDQIQEKLVQLLDKVKQTEKELARLKQKLSNTMGDDLIANAQVVNGVHVLAKQLDDVDATALRHSVDQLKNKLGRAIIVLASVQDQKVRIVVGVTTDTITEVKAGELANMVAIQVGGRGGGRADLAQAGGTDPSLLGAALTSVFEWVSGRIS